MSTKQIFLIGASGHGMVVMDALVSSGWDPDRICFLDESAARVGVRILDRPISRLEETADLSAHFFHVSIGNNSARQRVFERIEASGATPQIVIHPASTIAPSATTGAGSFIAARAIIGPAAKVEAGAIINHGAIVDHECHVGGFCHVGPGTTLGGNVRLGMRVFLGAGANVLPGVTIGDDAIIGAGAVVTANVPAQTTYAGVPARRIR
jgi:sugar O-acyltransferase (sialic acid O-acetyltransferase NeuD family)